MMMVMATVMVTVVMTMLMLMIAAVVMVMVSKHKTANIQTETDRRQYEQACAYTELDMCIGSLLCRCARFNCTRACGREPLHS